MKFTADFETTTDENDCRVWAFAICEIGNPDNFIYGNSIDEFMDWCADRRKNHTLYFHNLKFDGEFIIYWLLKNGFEHITDSKQKHDKTFTTLITDMGQFYSIDVYFEVKNARHLNKVKFLDSLKILNFSVEQIAKDFHLPIQKLELDYKEKRPVGHQLTEHEVAYIRNDVEIMARALQIMFDEDLTKMTIASDALNDFKSTCPNFRDLFPVLPIEIDRDIRQSYKGGFTYLNPIYKEKETGAGIVFDSNSMYPARMYNEILPYSDPIFFEGQYQTDPLYPLYVQQLTCEFELKEGKIPSIQIKHNSFFIPNEYVESSDGVEVTLVLTSVDLELFFENYNVTNITYHSGWKFKGTTGIFKTYIDKWTASKIQAKKDGNFALYRISKLMLNSLYGRFGLNGNSRKKIPKVAEHGKVGYEIGQLEERKTVYVAMASFITSYARANIIRASEAIREYSMKKYGFDAYVYSDTDSIHCLLNQEDVKELSKSMDIDDYKLGSWKLESTYVRGKYLRQKCYIEQESYDSQISVTVAGFPKRLAPCVTFDNFKIGFTTEGMDLADRKLTYKHVEGGVILVDTDFTIK